MEESVEQNYIYERASSLPHAGTDRIVSSSQVKAFSFYDWLIFFFFDLRRLAVILLSASAQIGYTNSHRQASIFCKGKNNNRINKHLTAYFFSC